MGGNEKEIDDDIKLIEKTMPNQQQNLIVMNTMITQIFQSDFREASFTHLIFGSIFNLPLAVGRAD